MHSLRTHLPVPGAFLLVLLASICANGCSEDSNDNDIPAPQNVNVCTSNADCAARIDGLTQCDIINHVCVFPQAQVAGCTGDADCSARMDGKTRCDMALHQCVVPTPVAQGCTSDANCIARTDGKTRCDMASRQCVVPLNKGFCGNAYIDAGEDCDGTLFVNNKIMCSAWNAQYISGFVSCNNCKVDFSNCITASIPVCNNGIIDAGEDCDGTLFVDNKNTCSAWNAQYTSGNVSCNNCKVDLSNCSPAGIPVCNNGIIDAGEDCDGTLFVDNKNTCSAWNAQYTSGNVSCNNCKVDLSNCSTTSAPTCNNGKIDSGEDCDGALFIDNKNTCSAWNAQYTSGSVSCNNCKVDLSQCSAAKVCGNGKVDSGEFCDGTLFYDNKNTCSAWDAKYTSGNVSCKNCELDFSECGTASTQTCNNGKIDSGEDCDGSLFANNKNTCSAWDAKYTSGSVSCNNCKVDLSKCSAGAVCGNGQIDSGELCDGSLFANNKNTCSAWDAKYPSGSVSCNGCKVDLSKCNADPPECTNGDAECIEKELSIKKCIKGKWVSEKCPETVPYCKTGAEACSKPDNAPCNPNTFVPHLYYVETSYFPYYYYKVILCSHAGKVMETRDSLISLKAKRGYGVEVNGHAEKCNEKGMGRTFGKESTGYFCQKCKVTTDGQLYWLFVPATYTNEGSTVSCVPWDDVE